MTCRNVILAAALMVAPLSGLSSPAAAADPDTVVATVNGQSITLAQMVAMSESLPEDAQALPDGALWDLLLDQMVRQAAVAGTQEEAMTARDKASIAIQRRAYLSGVALEKIAAPEPTDEELRAIYSEAFGASDAPKVEYNASHILVKTREEAEAIRKELDGGADFGELAAQRSTDNSGPNKGDLGWFTADMMVAPFAAAVQALEKGEISEPVESQFGWHVIRLQDSRQAEVPAFEDVRPQLVLQARRSRVDRAIEEILSEAEVEKTEGLDPALLRDDTVLGQ